MYYLHNSRLLIQDETMSVVLSSRTDYFSNKMYKNKYKSFQLIASKKENNLKTAEEQIAQIVYLLQQLSLWSRDKISIEKVSFSSASFVCLKKDISFYI